MKGFDSAASTALIDSCDFTHSTALTSIETQFNGLQDPFSFFSRTTSSLTTFDDLNDTTSTTNWLISTDAIQPVMDFFSLDQSTWSSRDDLTGLATGINQTAIEGLDFASSESAIAQPVSTQTTQPTIQLVGGTLGSDTFTVLPGFQYNVFSGNSNVEFGEGGRDLIDLSRISFSSVSFDLATTTRGGVLFNPGNGTRLFDAINFSNGSQVLFEGMDQVRFAQ